MQRKGGDGKDGAADAAVTPTSQDSKRQKKKRDAKLKKKSVAGDETNSKKEKAKKKTRRRTRRHHRSGQKSTEMTSKTSNQKPSSSPTPQPPPATTPPAPPDSPPKPTQDEQQPSRRPVKATKREREKVQLDKFLSKPIPKDIELANNVVSVGSVIETEKLKYKVIRKLGAGGCGETFVVQNLTTKRELCAKVEFLNKQDQRLSREFNIYREIDKVKRKDKGNLPHLLRCYDFGEVDKKVQFMFLPLCENSLEGYMKTGSPSLATGFELSIQVLEGIIELHSIGYIHRDLKPANIVINAELTKAFIIDFGMSCKFITDPAKMPESSVYDFIGTTKYAPREAHKGLPQSRKSDIEAWIYVILELFVPDILPWRDCTKNKEVAYMKELFFTTCYSRRIAQAPSCFSEILPIIESTTVVAAPDYEKMFELIRKEAESRKIKLKQKFKFDSTLIDLEIELWKTGKEQSHELDQTKRTTSGDDELKMDSEKTQPKTATLMSKTPSRTSSVTNEVNQKDGEEQAVLHSSMKCRVVVPPLPDGAVGSDDDSDQAKGSAKQNRL